jgi:hypothetical protein
MAIEYAGSCASLSGTVGVEDAEALLEWLQKTADAQVDLSACTHLHPANLQVLMAATAEVAAWPADAALADWLRPLFASRPPAKPSPVRATRRRRRGE